MSLGGRPEAWRRGRPAATVFAGARPRLEPALILNGALTIGTGIAGMAWTMPQGPVAALLPASAWPGRS